MFDVKAIKSTGLTFHDLVALTPSKHNFNGLKEKKILEITNPVSFAKQRHYESTDLKNLEKRREQRVLKNKLIQS